MLINNLEKQKLISPPKWLSDNCSYLTIMGSMAYGVSNDSSDMDIYGFCVPPKNVIFPHSVGIIPGFGNQGEKFEQWQEHHVKSNDKEYDFTVYSIVKYFQLCMENNPNMIDSLFTPRNCVIHSTQISELVRQNRRLFLHKGCYHKFKRYAYAQMSKIQNKANSSNPKRAETIEKFGYDLKFAYHLIRLLNEAEQILMEHDLDLQKNNEQLKSIRRGEWTIDELYRYFQEKEKNLEELYVKSDLRIKPDEDALKKLLIECLEIHYGSLEKLIKQETNSSELLKELEILVRKYQ